MSDFSRNDLERQISYLVSYARKVSGLLEGLPTPAPKLAEERLRQEWRQCALSDDNMTRVLDMIDAEISQKGCTSG